MWLNLPSCWGDTDEEWSSIFPVPGSWYTGVLWGNGVFVGGSRLKESPED